ncbi:hypothetical protein CGZ88_0091 [Bifidobacterium anseris]|uniref:Transmembrane serine/threonine-protein kinase B n=1 Tax=Bifidobacterium anseris TaxID=2020963 RepID=A0A2N5J140_9BIFI|nr:hypothetical protein CGZ88_0091 [Bifidobacterium anseris]
MREEKTPETCSRCGACCAPDAEFCRNCGGKLRTAMDSVSVTTVAKGAMPPIPAVPLPSVPPPAGMGAAPSPCSPSGDHMKASARNPRKLPLTIIAMVAVVLLVITGFVVTYNLHLWGSHAVPYFSADDESPSADDVLARLQGDRFNAKKRQEFSKEKRGAYLRLDGVQEGERIERTQEITVVESLGPGVPEGTIGEDEGTATEILSDMGVPVTKYTMVSDDPGKVVATFPQDGHALEERDGTAKTSATKTDTGEADGTDTGTNVGEAAPDSPDGIKFAVGVKGDGVPVEVYGVAQAEAERLLRSRGFEVGVKLVPADRDMIGKVVRTEPQIGKESAASRATMYIGANAKDLRASMMITADGVEESELYHGKTPSDLSTLIGQWCTDAGDCVELAPTDSTNEGTQPVRYLQMKRDGEHVGAERLDNLPGVHYMPDYDVDKPEGAFRYQLGTGSTGVLDIYDTNQLALCGTQPRNGVGWYCDHGTPKSWEESDDDGRQHKDSGLVYRMSDYLIVVPVDADIASVSRSGYFVQSDEKTGQADADRPYLLIRDPRLYDADDREVSALSMDGGMAVVNPFIPTESGSPKMKFAPAPSAESAYYLVQPSPFDWTAMGEGEAVCDEQGCDVATKAPVKQKAADMTIAQIRSAVKRGDFTPIAGRYCQKKTGDCLTLDDDGTVTGPRSGYVKHDAMSTTLTIQSSVRATWFPEGTVKDHALELKAPESDTYCMNDRAGENQGEACLSGDYAYGSDIRQPLTLTYYAKGLDLSQHDEYDQYAFYGVTPPDPDTPFLHRPEALRPPPPADENVYYLVD